MMIERDVEAKEIKVRFEGPNEEVYGIPDSPDKWCWTVAAGTEEMRATLPYAQWDERAEWRLKGLIIKAHPKMAERQEWEKWPIILLAGG